MAKVPSNKQEIETAKERLRELLPKGSRVHCVVRSVSKSGMSRKISPMVLQIFPADNPADPMAPLNIRVRPIAYNAARVLGWSLDRKNNDAIIVNGCGMNMVFHLVYSLGEVLYGDGYALKHDII